MLPSRYICHYKITILLNYYHVYRFLNKCHKSYVSYKKLFYFNTNKNVLTVSNY